MLRFRDKLAFPVATLIVLLGASVHSQQAVSPNITAQNQQPETKYETLAKGIAATLPFQVQFISAPLRLEIRNLLMGRGTTETIPTPTRILMEVRQGAITATTSQGKHEWRQGDFWAVENDSSLTIQNDGEVAVIRAIYIIEGKR